MKVLIACEFSGVVREAFQKKGNDAWSCDILPTEIEGQHYQCDVREVLNNGWDLMIGHPPCTYLTISGNRWYKPEYAERFPSRMQDKQDAIDFFMLLANAPVERIAIENPIGIMSTQWRKPDQIIQPFQFGHSEPKKTCLWLKNLPKLEAANNVEPGEYVTFKSGRRIAKWYSVMLGAPGSPHLTPEERMLLRSKTFQGIADAMADQWTGEWKPARYAPPEAQSA